MRRVRSPTVLYLSDGGDDSSGQKFDEKVVVVAAQCRGVYRCGGGGGGDSGGDVGVGVHTHGGEKTI